MKQFLGGLLVIMMASVFAQGQGNKVEQEILNLEQQWQDALLKSDVAALEKIYSDGLIYTHSSAATDTKATYNAKIKSGAAPDVVVGAIEGRAWRRGENAPTYLVMPFNAELTWRRAVAYQPA